MKTPKEKYQNDAQFRALVDMMELHIHQADFTPSEMREAAMLASIHYEYRRINPVKIQNPEVENAFKILSQCADSRLKG